MTVGSKCIKVSAQRAAGFAGTFPGHYYMQTKHWQRLIISRTIQFVVSVLDLTQHYVQGSYLEIAVASQLINISDENQMHET